MIVRYRVSVLVRLYFSDEFFLFSDFFFVSLQAYSNNRRHEYYTQHT